MKWSIYLFAALLLASCSSSTENSEDNNKNPLRAYFFPLDELAKEGVVYQYNLTNNDVVYDYRYCQTITDEQNKRFLVTTTYDPFFNQTFLFRDWEIANGMMREDYKIFFTDSTNTSKSSTGKIDPNSKAVYLFEPFEDSTASYSYKMEYQIPGDPNTFKLTREQFFKGYGKHKAEGEEKEVAIFTYKEYIQVDNLTEGGMWDVEREVTEYFAKGIGLVYHKEKNSLNPAPIVYELKKRFSMAEFEKKATDFGAVDPPTE